MRNRFGYQGTLPGAPPGPALFSPDASVDTSQYANDPEFQAMLAKANQNPDSWARANTISQWVAARNDPTGAQAYPIGYAPDAKPAAGLAAPAAAPGAAWGGTRTDNALFPGVSSWLGAHPEYATAPAPGAPVEVPDQTPADAPSWMWELLGRGPDGKVRLYSSREERIAATRGQAPAQQQAPPGQTRQPRKAPNRPVRQPGWGVAQQPVFSPLGGSPFSSQFLPGWQSGASPWQQQIGTFGTWLQQWLSRYGGGSGSGWL